jgi:hypothetical protein
MINESQKIYNILNAKDNKIISNVEQNDFEYTDINDPLLLFIKPEINVLAGEVNNQNDFHIESI